MVHSPWRPRGALFTGGLLLALTAPMSGVAAAGTSPAPTATASSSSSSTPSPSSTPLTSAPSATGLRLTRSAGTVTYGAALTLSGRLTRADGSPVTGAPVQLLSRTAGQSSTVVLATLRTGAEGQLSRQVTPRTTAEYQLRYGGDALTTPGSSNKTVTYVQPRISGAFTPAGVKLGQASMLRGSVSPAYFGTHLAIRRRLQDGSWQDAAVVGIDGSGTYAWSVQPGAAGRYLFQVVLPVRPAHLEAATPALAVQVDARDLHLGDRGDDVLTLQRRLAAQSLDVGAVDGIFGYDLAHAVLAFQKSQGIPRTGSYDDATRVRLGSPSVVRLRYPSAGWAVEIDLTKQVLYLSEAGALRRILDVSTGSGELYDLDGVTYRAATPLGSFLITRKIDDPQHQSPLGILYRPVFFDQGYAIHGSGSVPAYPASHGCVRITDPAMDRLYDLLTVGMRVTVYAG